jgi:hypothetical protein
MKFDWRRDVNKQAGLRRLLPMFCMIESGVPGDDGREVP